MTYIEICKTELFNEVIVKSYHKFIDSTYQYFIDVSSDNPFQKNWSRVILESRSPPSGEILDFCFMIHSKVLKHIRKRIKKGTGRLLSKIKYRKLFDAQEGICYLCHEPLSIYDCTIDHVKPVSRGGKDSMRNILFAHSRCNSEKSNRLPTKNEVIFLGEIVAKMKKIFYERHL